MSSNNKKTFESVKDETIIPIGFYEHKNSHSLFCRIKESPKQIYLIPGKRTDFCRFSQYKEVVTFKNNFLDGKTKPENIDNIVSSTVNNKKVITFTYKKNKIKYLYWAISKKENEWIVQDQIAKIKEIGGAVSDHKHGKNYVLYYGEHSIHALYSPNFLKWKHIKEPVLKARPGFFDKHGLKFIASKITDKGVLVFYDSSFKEGKQINIQIGVAMFSLSDPCKLIWRSDEPIFSDCMPYEKDFECKGMIFSNSKLAIYWHSKAHGLVISSFAVPFHSNLTKEKIKILSRHHANPVISPKVVNGKGWMAEGAFNPAAIVIRNRTHLLFRAVGNDGISRVGYASSRDGMHFDELHPEPVFYLKKSHFGTGRMVDKYDPVMYPSGGSWGGCEDPRLVKIDDKIYMTFNAFDGWDFIRVGYTSIKEKDFEKQKWNWTKPQLISPCGEINKNWVIFPEKINGKFAILHSLTPEVQIDYVDHLEDLASGKAKIKSKYGRKAPRRTWDTWVRGAGPTPIKTEDGWLVFYHAISGSEPSKYKLGVMLLDLNNPTKIIARSSSPILLPDMWYENEGKPGIVYACGAVVRDNKLFIYYGGGDKFVCVATVGFKEFMDSFKHASELVPFISKVIFA